MSKKQFYIFGNDIRGNFGEVDKLLNNTEVVDLLNEQQELIEELQAKLKEKQEDEKLYAQEILELNKTKKEMLNFKQLGGDY